MEKLAFRVDPATDNDRGMIAISEQDTVLDNIRKDHVAMAIWARELTPSLQAWLDATPDEALPTGRVLIRPDQTEMALCAMSSNVPKVLIADVGYLTARFAEITGSDRVDLRLDCIGHDGCWKFHRDRISHRLLCTYRGSGTEFVPQDCGQAALDQQRDYKETLQHLDPPFVGLFRGETTEKGTRGIVHRSPPISSTGTSRYLLCLSVPFAGSPPPF